MLLALLEQKKINSPINIIGALTSDLIYYYEVWKEECAGSVHRHMGREAFPGLG